MALSDGHVCILVDRPRMSAALEGKILWGYDMHIVEEKCKRVGIAPSRITVESISLTPNKPDTGDYSHCLNRLNEKDYNVIIALDELALRFTTGKESIWKWHLSPLDSLPGFKCRKVIPTFHPDQIKKEWHLGLYFEMAARRANEHSATNDPWRRKDTRYLLDPGFDVSIATLETLLKDESRWLSIDIETGRSQINTFGVAWTPEDAIAIKLLPDDMPTAAHHKLWELIARLCESPNPKVMQNGIYERMYLSRYGIEIKNFTWDTMCAMKFLWPELEKGLDNVGRIYTLEPYWKDDGRVASEEGKQKDWNNIRDWPRHLAYNCKDTSNTLAAKHGQKEDMEQRGLLPFYQNYIAQLFDCIFEMGSRGFPLNPESQKKLIAEYETKSAELVKQLSQEINPRSPKQKLKLLKDKGFEIPKKRVTGKESADELSLKKLRIKYPDDTDLKVLLEVAGIEKALSSYLRVRTFPDCRIRFMLDPHGTETGRMSCGKDPWDRGFNAQTMTDYVKQMIEFPESDDRVFIEVDLSQAESRFVAYDAVEENLLRMLDRKDDIHSYVAAEIFGCSVADVIAESKREDIPTNQKKRQLGKKSGHGANYNMGVNTFMDSCLKEMDLVLDRKMATRVLESYHKLFPGIRRWHAQIRNTVYRERRLSNPLGRVRYFYGRPDDNTYREAYAYRPQSTVPDITNHLMLSLKNKRTEGAFDFWLHCQVHDSIIVSCRTKEAEKIIKHAKDTSLWHPEIVLPAGRLVIPTDAKMGRCLGQMTKFSG